MDQPGAMGGRDPREQAPRKSVGFIEREVAKSPPVAAVLRRTPAVFGANHAALMRYGSR